MLIIKAVNFAVAFVELRFESNNYDPFILTQLLYYVYDKLNVLIHKQKEL